MRACRRRRHLLSRTLYIINVYRLNFDKLSRNFVEAIRTTTSNCRVSFINLYLVFAINFWIVFLPHTNTVILLEPYSGTITEPGYFSYFLTAATKFSCCFSNKKCLLCLLFLALSVAYLLIFSVFLFLCILILQ